MKQQQSKDFSTAQQQDGAADDVQQLPPLTINQVAHIRHQLSQFESQIAQRKGEISLLEARTTLDEKGKKELQRARRRLEILERDCEELLNPAAKQARLIKSLKISIEVLKGKLIVLNSTGAERLCGQVSANLKGLEAKLLALESEQPRGPITLPAPETAISSGVPNHHAVATNGRRQIAIGSGQEDVLAPNRTRHINSGVPSEVQDDNSYHWAEYLDRRQAYNPTAERPR